MIKPPFMEELEKNLRPEEKIFKFRSAELIGDVFKLELLVGHDDYDSILTKDLENKVKTATQQIVPSSFKANVRFVKASNEDDFLTKQLLEYIYKEKPMVFSGFQTAKIEYDHNSAELICITITLEKYLYEYAVNSNLKSELDKYLSGLCMEDVEVDFVEIPNADNVLEIISSRNKTNSFGLRTINVSINKYYSGNISQSPRYIVDVKDKESAQACICGAVSDVQCRYIEKIDKNLFTFQLNDTTGQIKVKFFERKLKNVKWEEVIVDGAYLVTEGQIKFDNYDSAFEFFPRSFASCVIDFASIDLMSDFLPTPEAYVHIFPHKIEEVGQDNLFAKEPNPEFFRNEFVVFDVETTGLDTLNDEIIEIAAVKIVNGEMKESFDCLINPQRTLPEKITEITRITDDMLKDKFVMKDVIGDFYKFTRGAVMVAHNASFDMGMITVAGKRNKYDFDNSYVDTLAMARQKLKLNNYKLATVCNYFGVPLIGAHRAINDTLATAKMFIELMNM